MKITTITITLLTLFLTACSSGGDKTSDPYGLNGLWVASCYFDSDYEDYNNETYTFSGNSFSTTIESFTDSSCNGEPYYQDEVSGTFELGETVITSNGPEALEFDAAIIFENEIFDWFSLIDIDGDSMYFGVWVDDLIRPTEIDFNVKFNKQ